MTEDLKFAFGAGVMLIVILAAAVFGGLKCESNRQAFVLECLKTGRAVAECNQPVGR